MHECSCGHTDNYFALYFIVLVTSACKKLAYLQKGIKLINENPVKMNFQSKQKNNTLTKKKKKIGIAKIF